ncbi:transglycosylase associated protein [Streptococcus equinus ATCC 9812]|jgi:uncharacterized membrane protein YeaQ/YmgE (transglycosylase-associated protein family)|uniref:Transglycosylase associated protein n=4 Tax=Streptococcus TaxID=1301 RepID=E8JR10_STREI|nr:transglycosylase associated protein [Streptococcus equinus ATCC 9812]
MLQCGCKEIAKYVRYLKKETVMIGSLIVGALIGMMAGAITKKGESMGCVYNIFAGLVGSFVGQSLFGYWGPTLADMAILPSVLGAIIVIAVVDLFFG